MKFNENSQHKSFILRISLLVLSLLSSFLIYQYLQSSSANRLLTKEKNSKWSYWLDKFRNETRDFEECDDISTNGQSCDCFKHQIDVDLENWRGVHLSSSLLENSKSFGVHYQIIDNKLYRQKRCLFPPRCQGVEHFLLQVLEHHHIKNIDLLINVHDWPQVHNNYKKELFPVFSFSKDTNLFKDIIYPAWAFHSGGPAINMHPNGIGKWDVLKKQIANYSNRLKFSEKKNQAFFRGSRTSDERDPIILLSRNNPNLIDAKYTKNQAWRSIKDTLDERPAPEVSFQDHCNYRYLINMRGVAASFRYRHLFMCNSLVLNVKSRWIEFFYSAMKPWYHYVPIEEEARDLLSILKFLKKYPQVARQIANNGFEFISKKLSEQSVLCYWIELLDRYQLLIDYKVKPEKDYIRIK